MVELHHDLPINVVQSDWGGEFRYFAKFFIELGIIHRIIFPHAHHKNRVVERKHMHRIELGLNLLSQASLLITYWDYAFSIIVHLINRLQTSSLNFQVPYTILFNPKKMIVSSWKCLVMLVSVSLDPILLTNLALGP